MAEGRWLRALGHPALRIAVPVVIAGIAVVVLHRMAADIAWADLRADMAAIPARDLALAVLATAASFAGIAAYDRIALAVIAPGAVPPAVALAGGAGGAAVSNLLGFSWLTGVAVRARLYGARGVTPGQLARLFAAAWVAFWVTALGLFGAMLVVHPAALTAMTGVPPLAEDAIGVALLLAIGAAAWRLTRPPATLRIGGRTLPLPPPGAAFAMCTAALVDIGGVALALYVLMPAGSTGTLPFFFMVFVAAILLGIASHAPGGIGVFEATVIAGLGAAGRPDVLAALLVFRAIYYLLPFAVAALALALATALNHRAAVAGAAQATLRLLRPVVPPVAAGVALLSGILLLVTGTLPAAQSRLGLLRSLLPLGLVEASHMAGSIAGLLLIVVARGLSLRRAQAWRAAMALLAVGAVAALARGLDWGAALSLAGAMALLWTFRAAFYRAAAGPVLHLTAGWFATVAALVAATVWIGVLSYGHVAYRDALWWQMAWAGDAPRFLRASLAAAVVLAGLAVNSLVTARSPRIAPQPIPPAVRRLVAASPDSQAALALTGDKAFLLEGRAFIAFADAGGSLIARGEPVGDPEAGRRLAWDLRELADRMGRRCAFYGVGPAFLPTFLDMGLQVVKIGEVARVDLARFTLEGPERKGFRNARSRAGREGFRVVVLPPDQAAPLMPALRAVSNAWLAGKAGDEKGFAVGRFDEDYLAAFPIAVLRHETTGEIAAFANILAGADRTEASVDLMRYRPDGPAFAMAALFAELLLWARAQGFARFSLGAAPLSGLARHPRASRWNRIGGFIFTHGEALYHFEGLRSFKQKFDPDWQPSYLASSGGLSLPRVLYDINVLVSGGVAGLVRHRRG